MEARGGMVPPRDFHFGDRWGNAGPPENSMSERVRHGKGMRLSTATAGASDINPVVWLKNFLAHQQQLSSFLEARNASEHLLAIRTRSKPPGFILPCQPALADHPPSLTAGSMKLSLMGIA
jgi:hypothetical protein